MFEKDHLCRLYGEDVAWQTECLRSGERRGKGHAGGNSFFGVRICQGLKARIVQLRCEQRLNRRDAIKEARQEADCINRMPEFAEAWAQECRNLSVAVWVTSARWEQNYLDLSMQERLKFVEAKLLVDFVRENQRLPELNKTFG